MKKQSDKVLANEISNAIITKARLLYPRTPDVSQESTDQASALAQFTNPSQGHLGDAAFQAYYKKHAIPPIPEHLVGSKQNHCSPWQGKFKNIKGKLQDEFYVSFNAAQKPIIARAGKSKGKWIWGPYRERYVDEKIWLAVLRDSQREQKVTLPEAATVGEVMGLAVSGDHGCLLRFEMQATKGSGRIVPLGSIQKVMRESIEAAAQYVKAKHEELSITAEWRQSYDVAILGTFMGVPKEGPSAGVALVTGIVSVLKGLKVRNDLAMTGEITILGKVLPVGGIQQKLLAAYEAGIKEVLIPVDNVPDTAILPAAVKAKLKITPVSRVEEVLKAALIS